MGSWSVYLIKNKANGKGYVGITSKTIQDRFKEHITDAQGGEITSPNGRIRPLHAAMNKYGLKSFDIRYLERRLDLREAQRREEYRIRKLNTYASGTARMGYNQSYGGEEPDTNPDDY